MGDQTDTSGAGPDSPGKPVTEEAQYEGVFSVPSKLKPLDVVCMGSLCRV
jgi:hypothetical protein